MIESTYGDKSHEGRRERIKRLDKMLVKAISDNGVVIIQAFSIGAYNSCFASLSKLFHILNSKNLADIEVIVDSTMAAKFTEYFERLYTVDTHQ